MKNKTYLLNLIALISIYVINGAGSFENAAVQTMMEAWLVQCGNAKSIFYLKYKRFYRRYIVFSNH